jgi:hypothetical protein
MLAFRVPDTKPGMAPPVIPLIKGLVTVKLRQNAAVSSIAAASLNPNSDQTQPWLLVVLAVVLVNAWALATAVLVAKA